MKLFEQLGRVALGTRIRFLGDRISQDAEKIYGLYGVDLQPKWFPVFYVLSQERERTVTSIARDIGHSHASVSKIVGEMSRAGLLTEKTSAKDRRRTMVSLSKAGRALTSKIDDQYRDVKAAMDDISKQSTHDLWRALEEWEYLLENKSLYERVLDQKKRRASAKVKIVPYKPKFLEAFRRLNTEWISTYFKLEEADHKALDNPEKSILKRGGCILVAVHEGRAVGVCALLKRDDPVYPYELAKMAVDTSVRGRGIGLLLGEAILEKARELKADRVFLESNTRLKPALALYEKLGFKKVVGPPTPYERCNIQMEVRL